MKTIQYIKNKEQERRAKEQGYDVNIISKDELYYEIMCSKEQDMLTNRAVEILQKFVTHTVNFMLINVSYSDKELYVDMVMFDCLEKWRKFDGSSGNIYAYFRTLIGMKLKNHIQTHNDKRILRYNDLGNDK